MMMKKMMTFLIYKIGVALWFEKLICSSLIWRNAIFVIRCKLDMTLLIRTVFQFAPHFPFKF